MIPRDALVRHAERAGYGMAAAVIFAFILLLATLALNWAVQLSDWMFVLIMLLIIGVVIGVAFHQERSSPRCPACQHRFMAGAVLRSTRCPRCFTIITIPESAEERRRTQSRRRAAYVRSGIYVILAAGGIPLLLWWLRWKQILPPAGNWVQDFAPIVPGAAMLILATPFALWSRHVRKQRLAEDRPLPPPYPTLQVAQKNTVFRLYFAPTMLCLARTSGSFSDEHAFDQQGGVFLKPFLEYALRRKRRREALYDTIDPATPDLLLLDRRNVQIPRDQVTGLQVLPSHTFTPRERIFRFGKWNGLVINRNGAAPLTLAIREELSAPEIQAVLAAWQAKKCEISALPAT